MYENVRSLGIFVGTSKCNANCSHCAGIIHRQYAEKIDGTPNLKRIREVLDYCVEKNLKSISISGSGEPILSTKSVTKVLQLIQTYNKRFKINLYTNGISLSKNRLNLQKWKNLGLTHIYLSAHSSNDEINSKFLNIDKIINLKNNIEVIHSIGLSSRINFRLSKENIPDIDTFIKNIKGFKESGVNQLSCWCIRDDSDEVSDELAPNKDIINQIKEVVNTDYSDFVIFNYNNDVVYNTGEKLTLFPDGTLNNKWCKNKL